MTSAEQEAVRRTRGLSDQLGNRTQTILATVAAYQYVASIRSKAVLHAMDTGRGLPCVVVAMEHAAVNSAIARVLMGLVEGAN